PDEVVLRGTLVGAGTTGAGFAIASSPLTLRGSLDVVDHDVAWYEENFGPHLLVSTKTNGVEKVALLQERLERLHRGLHVIPRPERFRLFKYRLGKEVAAPDVVITGLDRSRPRREVQRLWAPVHIDMATKDGLQVQ